MAVNAMLRVAHPPTALIASNGVMLMAVMQAVQALGLAVSDDVALAGFDNQDWMAVVGRGLSVIEQPVEEIGRVAMAMLLDRIDHPDAAARRVVLSGRLILHGAGPQPKRCEAPVAAV